MSDPLSHHRPDRDASAPVMNSEGAMHGEEDRTREWAEELDRCRGVLDAVLSHRLPNAADREDCLQTIFVLAMQHGDEVPAAFRRAWLFKTAANQATLHWRKKKIDERAVSSIGCSVSEAPSQYQTLEREETNLQMMRELERLPPRAREMIRLKFFDNLTYQQIAQRLDVPLGTALTTVRRTLMKLREHWNNDET